MTMIPLLIAAVTSGTAHAGEDAMGLRVKFSTPVVQNTSMWNEVEGDDDPFKMKTTGISTFDGDNRFELTYKIGDTGIEAGAWLGYNRTSSKVENDANEAKDEDITVDTNTLFLVTGAYNIKMGGGKAIFIQPAVGVNRFKSTNKPGDAPFQTNFVMFGGDAGIRLKAYKRTSIDLAAEYLTGNGTYIADGEKDEDTTGKMTMMGLRAGISIML